jgi:hypothetical protein
MISFIRDIRNKPKQKIMDSEEEEKAYSYQITRKNKNKSDN